MKNRKKAVQYALISLIPIIGFLPYIILNIKNPKRISSDDKKKLLNSIVKCQFIVFIIFYAIFFLTGFLK